MVQLWYRNREGLWSPSEIENQQIILSSRNLAPMKRKSRQALLIVASVIDNRTDWILFAPAHREGKASAPIKVNGSAIIGDMVQLRNKDQFQSETAECFFTTQRLQQITRYEGEVVFCPCCQLEIRDGTEVVICPQCLTAYHQYEERTCWTYAHKCNLCPEVVDLGSNRYGWSPNEL